MIAAPAMYSQTAAPVTNCPTPVKHHFKKKPVAAPCADFEAQLAKQQAEIDALKAQLAGQQPAAAAPAEVDPIASPIAKQAAADAADAASKAAAASAAAQAASAQAAATDAAYKAEAKKLEDEIESPTAIHYKGVLLQPGGFFAAESVYRNRTFNSDIATPFSATPYPNSDNYRISEFNGSARQSRISLLVKAPFSWGTAGGYFETDFLGAGTTSNNNQTNSYVLRIRSAFAQATLNNGFSIQGGQMFTLATEDKKGVLAGPGAEALPPTIDPNYHVGFDFGRQYGVRVAQSFAAGKVNAAFSIEESQIVFTGSNAPGNFFFGGAGASGGLYNSTGGSSGGGSATLAPGVQNYTDNLAPDLHLKVALDPGKGLGHYEVGGIVRFFRDRIYPQTTYSTGNTTDLVSAAYNNTSIGAGAYISGRVPVTKYADVALKLTYGKGIGRYEASNLGDVTARPDGVLVPLKTGDGLFELDLHPTPKFDIFVLAGAEYLQRTVYTSSTGVQVGYAPFSVQNDTGCYLQPVPVSNSGNAYAVGGNCAGATRYLAEFTPGITYRFFNSPTKGRLQFQATYSYLDRQAWQGYAGTTAPTFANGNFALPAGDAYQSAQGVTGMFHTSFRYYIP
jgi:hypothetical protein